MKNQQSALASPSAKSAAVKEYTFDIKKGNLIHQYQDQSRNVYDTEIAGGLIKLPNAYYYLLKQQKVRFLLIKLEETLKK